jgi:hypothetical protein
MKRTGESCLGGTQQQNRLHRSDMLSVDFSDEEEENEILSPERFDTMPHIENDKDVDDDANYRDYSPSVEHDPMGVESQLLLPSACPKKLEEHIFNFLNQHSDVISSVDDREGMIVMLFPKC